MLRKTRSCLGHLQCQICTTVHNRMYMTSDEVNTVTGEVVGAGHLEGETKQNVKIKQRGGGREKQTDR